MKRKKRPFKAKTGKKRKAFAALVLFAAIITLSLGDFIFFPPAAKKSLPSPKIRILMDNQLKEIALEDFLVGVIAGEMPAAFPLEALKAQAIAARTYIYIHSPLNPKGDKSRHPGAAVCCDPNHCQAYLNKACRKEKWGAKTKEYEEKICQAVNETRGQIITYKGLPAEAPYFSTCGGKTESAGELWGSPRPYLISVECPWDKEAPNYQSRASFSLKEIAGLLDATVQEVCAMRELSKTSGGRVSSLCVGESLLSGSRVRELLGLKSAAFSWEIARDEIVFYVSGYGHGVGMCQFGAGGMAKAGYNYREIIKHYYSGVEITQAY